MSYYKVVLRAESFQEKCYLLKLNVESVLLVVWLVSAVQSRDVEKLLAGSAAARVKKREQAKKVKTDKRERWNGSIIKGTQIENSAEQEKNRMLQIRDEGDGKAGREGSFLYATCWISFLEFDFTDPGLGARHCACCDGSSVVVALILL